MTNRKNAAMLAALILAVGLVTASLTAVFITKYYNRVQFNIFAGLYQSMVEEQPEAGKSILSALKEYKNQPAGIGDGNILVSYGYTEADFLDFAQRRSVLFAILGFLAGSLLFLFPLWCWYRKNKIRIKGLTDYLENINRDKPGMLIHTEEDYFSGLQDEIYKTVTALYQTRDAAVKAKTNFAENLSNIAHQLKTPITAISLSIQMMEEESKPETLEQVQKQLDRLTRLEEALLLLFRIDAGTLPFEQKEIDVFTVLTLAADNLAEILSKAEVSVDIPEKGEIGIVGDLDWTMEAIMNLLKNCIEHAPAGSSIHCDYGRNPLYAEIVIWDEGPGFAKEDLPHLFERFYRGQAAKAGGSGIGLSISKAIFEMENGIIRAKNLPGGGACFEIRIYSH
ncbi:MAG TPA: HAMP domain-containing histidine kinase [Clostridiales bacterium]|nr:HAMP domain-containing histidine kinase [Clostridiales bacterium]